jgi:hypothetical protein
MDSSAKRRKVPENEIVAVNNYQSILGHIGSLKSLSLFDPLYPEVSCFPFIVKSNEQELHAVVSTVHEEIVYFDPAAAYLSHPIPASLLGRDAYLHYSVFTFARKTKTPSQIIRLVSLFLSYISKFPETQLSHLFAFISATSKRVLAYDADQDKIIDETKKTEMKHALNQLLAKVPIPAIRYYINDDDNASLEVVNVPILPRLPPQLINEVISHTGDLKLRTVSKSAKSVRGGWFKFGDYKHHSLIGELSIDRIVTLIVNSAKVTTRTMLDDSDDDWITIFEDPRIEAAISKTITLHIKVLLFKSKLEDQGLRFAKSIGRILSSPKCMIPSIEVMGWVTKYDIHKRTPVEIEPELIATISKNISVNTLDLEGDVQSMSMWIKAFAEREKNRLVSFKFHGNYDRVLGTFNGDDLSALILNNAGSLRNIDIHNVIVKGTDTAVYNALVLNLAKTWGETPLLYALKPYGANCMMKLKWARKQ